jgi:hypothetical protein
MKANNTGESNIKEVGKYFRLTFVFNALKTGNISSGNQSLCANYGNFNLNHTILIQGRTH